jgi:hypothetical protein
MFLYQLAFNQWCNWKAVNFDYDHLEFQFLIISQNRKGFRVYFEKLTPNLWQFEVKKDKKRRDEKKKKNKKRQRQ